jgi:hypothetical protein
VQNIYTALWGKTPNITIPFTVIDAGHRALDIGEVFQAITASDINERLNHTRQNNASGSYGIQRKHNTGHDVKELLRNVFNIILVIRSKQRLGIRIEKY